MANKGGRVVLTDNIIPQLRKRLPAAVDAVVQKTAAEVEKNAKEAMEGPKHGRTYRVSKTGKAHTASAPGEAPAIDTGLLHSSIMHYSEGVGKASVDVYADYGRDLEFGTRKMAARPFLRPAVEKAAKAFFEALRQLEKRLK